MERENFHVAEGQVKRCTLEMQSSRVKEAMWSLSGINERGIENRASKTRFTVTNFKR